MQQDTEPIVSSQESRLSARVAALQSNEGVRQLEFSRVQTSAPQNSQAFVVFGVSLPTAFICWPQQISECELGLPCEQGQAFS